MSVIHTIRESGDYRPEPNGDFQGPTRAGALAALLAQHQEPQHQEPHVPALRRALAFFGIVAQLIVATNATMTIRSGLKLTPAEAVAVLQSSHSDLDRTNVVPVGDGPTVVVVPCASCDVQRAIADATTWRRAGFVAFDHGFYVPSVYGSRRTTSRVVGPSNRVVTGRPGGRRK
jgi:hypothetical protein